MTATRQYSIPFRRFVKPCHYSSVPLDARPGAFRGVASMPVGACRSSRFLGVCTSLTRPNPFGLQHIVLEFNLGHSKSRIARKSIPFPVVCASHGAPESYTQKDGPAGTLAASLKSRHHRLSRRGPPGSGRSRHPMSLRAGAKQSVPQDCGTCDLWPQTRTSGVPWPSSLSMASRNLRRTWRSNSSRSFFVPLVKGICPPA